MESNEHIFDKIENYLNGKLSTEEHKSFEKEIASDNELAEMVDLHRFEKQVLDQLVANDLKQKLNEWEANLPKEEKKANTETAKQHWKTFATLFILALIAALCWYQYAKPDQPTPFKEPSDSQQDEPVSPPAETPDQQKPDVPMATDESRQKPTNPEEKKKANKENNYELLAQNIISDIQSSERAALTRKVEGAVTDNVLSAGFRAFLSNQMELAVTEFSKIDQSQYPEEYEQVQEYIGQAYLAQQKYKEAASVFQSIIRKNAPSTIDRAEWFLLLSLLPEYSQRKKEVDALLAKMTEPENYHNRAKSAADLQQRLKGLEKQ